MTISLDRMEHIENIVPVAGTDSAIRSYPINRDCSPYGPARFQTKDRSMAFLLIALLAGSVCVAGLVLADSGLRAWSAFGALGAQRAMLSRTASAAALPIARARPAARVTTRISYARTAPVPLRAAA